MGLTIERLDELLVFWSGSLFRASWQGGLAVAAVWVLVRFRPSLPPRVACWTWRLIDLKLIVALVWVTPVVLPMLPAAPPESAPTRIAPGDDRQAATGELGSIAIVADEPAATISFPRLSLACAVLMFWLAGAVGAAIVAARDRRALSRLRRSCPPVPSPDLRAALSELARALGVRGVPELRAGPGVVRPMLVGASRPAILLPNALIEDPGSTAIIRPVLAHELAHIRRGDLWWSALGGLVRSLFFFHPLVWLAHREATAAREAACDALALGASGVKPSEYGRILLNIAVAAPEWLSRPKATLSMAGSAGSLKRRLIAMKTFHQPTRRRLLSWACTLTALGAAGIIPWQLVPRAAVAQAPAVVSPPTVPAREARPSTTGRPEYDRKLAEVRLTIAEANRKSAEAERKAAEAFVEQAEAEAALAIAKRKYRSKTRDRMDELVKRGDMPAELLDAETERFRAAQADEQAQQAKVVGARAALDAATAVSREAQALRDIARLALNDNPDPKSKDRLTEARARLRTARLDRGRAERDIAQADVAQAEANLLKADANVAYRTKEVARMRELVEKQAIEQRILDQEEAALKAQRKVQQDARTANEHARAHLKAAAAHLIELKAAGDQEPVTPSHDSNSPRRNTGHAPNTR